MKEMEDKAVHELGAKAITLNTIDGEFASQPWWWEQQGLTFSKATRNNEQWYARLGYTAYKRAVPRYPTRTVDGRDILLESVVRTRRSPSSSCATQLTPSLPFPLLSSLPSSSLFLARSLARSLSRSSCARSCGRGSRGGSQ